MTRLPTEMDDEDPFVQVGETTFSLRQLLTLMIAFGLWIACAKLFGMVLPISPAFIFVFFLWIPISGLLLAFVSKDGVSLEEYLNRRLVFMFSQRHFILIDAEDKRDPFDAAPEAAEMDWDDEWDWDNLRIEPED